MTALVKVFFEKAVSQSVRWFVILFSGTLLARNLGALFCGYGDHLLFNYVSIEQHPIAGCCACWVWGWDVSEVMSDMIATPLLHSKFCKIRGSLSFNFQLSTINLSWTKWFISINGCSRLLDSSQIKANNRTVLGKLH